ncbi:MAG: Gfo/Idh/MocA family oxidoreductase [Gammaproteobacteria bacterium]|nr:Gfo/Idh/MocA family oxidoreductase [Gammaproteobacteria bacterium]
MFSEIQERKIRIGLVGCGRISKNHFGSIQEYPDDIELVSVCEIDRSVLKAHEEQYGVPGYRNA